MIKGDVFNKQYFPSNTFALFIDTFLDNKCGIISGYKNSMALSNTTNQVTISSGAVCIKGRFIREDSYTNIAVTYQATNYCILVIEIDLDKVNTAAELNQVSYKIIASENAYPSLTQTDIVKNESGKYQYELARFICNSSGISNFVDKRTFLDFDSIYAEIRRHIEDIDSGTLTTIPIASGVDYFGTTPPTNFMFADGSAISRTEYSALFNIIGTRYGTGDGSTTFNLPDKRERVSVMAKSGSTNGTSGASFGTLGAKGGEFKHALTGAENGTHNHGITDSGHSHSITDPGHSHSVTDPGHIHAYSQRGDGSGTLMGDATADPIMGSPNSPTSSSYTGISIQSHSTGISIKSAKTGISINNSGSGTAHNNLQPYFVCNYIIRVK